MSVTTTVARASLPYPTDRQFAALDALLDAYYALNAADDPEGNVSEWVIERTGSPMDLVRQALIKTLKFLPGVTQTAARRIFNSCISGGEPIRWNYDLWRSGVI